MEETKKQVDVIIVGAGASGLMAAMLLSRQGKKVLVLEGRDRIGGRIYSLDQDKWGYAAEGGAEFIHGNLQLSLQLLKEAGINKTEIGGAMWQVFEGEWFKDDERFENQQQLLKALKQLPHDMSLHDFMQQYFGDDEHEEMRLSIKGYVEGYYAADSKRLSALSFLQEWQSEDEQQYRPVGGYAALLKYMVEEIQSNGGSIRLSNRVKDVYWQGGKVQVVTHEHIIFNAKQTVVTVPLGVWLSPASDVAHINFHPALTDKTSAAAKLGFGPALKVLLKFSNQFWQTEQGSKNIGFIFSDETIGTWWTQNPAQQPVLVGWVAGPKAIELAGKTDEQILNLALISLANIFKINVEELQASLLDWEVFNWNNDPFAGGAYSYSTIDTKQALPILKQPVDNTLFFAGEALYQGTEMGTVEAALISGRDAADQILNS